MSTPFLGQVSVFGFNFAPKGFAFCNGQTLSISQNQALFALLGTTYGGNGVTTFALPNLQGANAINFGVSLSGTTYNLGQTGGEATHTLLAAELPAHTHAAAASAAAPTALSPVNTYPTLDSTAQPFTATVTSPFAQPSSLNAGGQAHPNQSPVLVLNYCIALTGIFPSRN